MVRRNDGEVSAILRLLEANELFHTLLFVEHATTGVSYFEHVGIGGVALQVLCLQAEHLADKIK